MSSTTSSDCESCGCSQCTYSFENNYNDYGKLMTNSRHVPIYATMAHPLIYYAEVPQPSNRRCNDQPRKDNPFKKAFKWYTQERGRMLSNKNDFCPERSGFANWLDSKYDEYLRESGQPAKSTAASGLPMKRDSRIPRDSIEEPCPGVSKAYGRLKSPWKNRRRSVLKDGGDVPEKGPCGSCEYILKPKELMRATSEHTPTSGEKSNATVTSSNMPCGNKCSGRSRSLSDVGRERSVPRHSDTIAPRAQEHEPAQVLLKNCMCHKEPPKTRCKCPLCLCPSEKEPELEVPELAKESCKKRHHPCCPCNQTKLKRRASTVQDAPSSLGVRLSEVVLNINDKIKEPITIEEPLRKEEPERLPYCPCPQEKVLQAEKLPSKTQSPTNAPQPLLEKQPEVVKEPSIKQPEVVKEPSVKQEPMRLSCCPCPQEKVPQVEPLPSKSQSLTNPPMPLQEKPPEVVKVPSKAQPIPQQEKVLEVGKVPSKALPIPQQAKVPEVVKIPSKLQASSDKPTPCCKCNLKKIPQIVQVPSQSRAVQESCQVPEEKLVPVNDETQYEPSLKPPRSAPSLRPCCCNTCNPQFPPPPIICLPVKVQSSKIFSAEPCLTTPSSICDSSKRQKKMTQKRSVSCQFDEGNKSKCDTQCQHQNEPCSCSKPCCSNCHAVNQACDPIPIRRQSHSTVGTNEDIEGSALKEVAVVSKHARSVTCASNDAAQTSDHSICFDKDGVCSCQCPLFLKIIYADIKE